MGLFWKRNRQKILTDRQEWDLQFSALIRRTRSGQTGVGIDNFDGSSRQNRTGAALVGVQITQITALVFVLGSAMAGAAGALYGSLFAITPYMASGPLMKGFILTVLGGLGSVPGAVLAGFLLGLAESFGSRSWVAPSTWS